ncbi:MAG: helix-turn-helix domain-containing protein [Saprospiraceae bacterium]
MKPIEKMSDTLTTLNIEGGENDYFIAPNIPLPDYPKDQVLRLGYYMLFICVKGQKEVLLNNIYEKIEQNCLYIFSPENSMSQISKSDDCTYRVLLFTKDFLLKNNFNADVLKKFNFFTDGKYNKIHLENDEFLSLIQLFDLLEVKNNKSQSPYQIEIIRSLILTFLYEAQIIFTKKNENTNPILKRENELNQKFNQLIKNFASTQHNLKFYANSLFVTPKHLISVIKNSTGKTPGSLIDEAILNEAKQNLVNTTLSIAKIADRLQFADNASFSKFFKRNTELSPSQYRKKYQI